MTASDALARTMLLMRRDLQRDISDEALLEALMTIRVAVVADENNLTSPEGQHALVTTALLVARSGAQCFVDAPNVGLLGTQPPLRKPRVMDGLLDIGTDLVPGQRIVAGLPNDEVDLTLVIGDSRRLVSAGAVLHISGDAWRGHAGQVGERWREQGSPFGALAAAGLGAAEAYKAAMRRLSHHAASPVFRDFFSAATNSDVALPGADTDLSLTSTDLGAFDFVSGGAIAQAALYALSRIPDVRGEVRVIEPDTNDISNINRYAFLHRSAIHTLKVDHLSSLDLGGLSLSGVPLRYDGSTVAAIGPLASSVLVGVDHVPSRWAVQTAQPRWLGIGATEGYAAMMSVHGAGLPCARCVHPEGAEAPGPIPTAAFISHWAGLWLASVFAAVRSGSPTVPRQQVAFLPTLQLGAPGAVWETPGSPLEGCRLGCSRAA